MWSGSSHTVLEFCTILMMKMVHLAKFVWISLSWYTLGQMLGKYLANTWPMLGMGLGSHTRDLGMNSLSFLFYLKTYGFRNKRLKNDELPRSQGNHANRVFIRRNYFESVHLTNSSLSEILK